MYLRWKTQQWKCREWIAPDDTPRTMTRKLCAVLVTSERRDGKPRQRVVKHLASINEDWKHRLDFRYDFLREVYKNLDGVNLPDEQRAAILEKVHSVIAPPAQGQIAELEADCREAEARQIKRKERKEQETQERIEKRKQKQANRLRHDAAIASVMSEDEYFDVILTEVRLKIAADEAGETNVVP